MAANDEYLLYQTLVGAWPGDLKEADAVNRFHERVEAFMLKAVQEEKGRTSWTEPNSDYEDAVAHDPRIDALRAKMQVRENVRFTEEYYADDKRYIGNAVQVFFKGGSASERIQVDFPIGHRKRRAEGMPVLVKKFEASVDAHFGAKQAQAIKALFAKRAGLDALPVNELVAALVTNS